MKKIGYFWLNVIVTAAIMIIFMSILDKLKVNADGKTVCAGLTLAASIFIWYRGEKKGEKNRRDDNVDATLKIISETLPKLATTKYVDDSYDLATERAHEYDQKIEFFIEHNTIFQNDLKENIKKIAQTVHIVSESLHKHIEEDNTIPIERENKIKKANH